MKISLKKDEQKVIPLLWLGTEKRLDYEIVLSEPGASVTFWGLLIGKQTAHTELNITVTHAASHTKSQIIVKSALYDQAKAKVDGLIKVEHGAKGSDAWLAANMMLLSPSAQGEAVPALEIVENEIKAGHATTIGKVDKWQLLYLMSRGFSRKEAKQMIVEGFLEDALVGLPKDLAQKARKELAHV